MAIPQQQVTFHLQGTAFVERYHRSLRCVVFDESNTEHLLEPGLTHCKDLT